MSLLHAVGVALCLAQPPEPLELPEGVYGLTCRVVAVKDGELLVALELVRDEGKRVRLNDRRHTPHAFC